MTLGTTLLLLGEFMEPKPKIHNRYGHVQKLRDIFRKIHSVERK